MSETRHCVVDARRLKTPSRETEKHARGVNYRTEDRRWRAEGVDFRMFSGKICLLFVSRGGKFESSRGLHHVRFF